PHGVRFAVMMCAESAASLPALAARTQGVELLFSPDRSGMPESVADDHRRWVRNCHVGLASLLQMSVVRANGLSTSRPGIETREYGDSFILNAEGRFIAEAGLSATGLITATI